MAAARRGAAVVIVALACVVGAGRAWAAPAPPVPRYGVYATVAADLAHVEGRLVRDAETAPGFVAAFDPESGPDLPGFALPGAEATAPGPREVASPLPSGWVDPFGALDLPTGDLAIQRSGPGWPDPGGGVSTPGSLAACGPAGCDTLPFATTLPRRYGDSGALRGEGLWANGTWLPVAAATEHPAPPGPPSLVFLTPPTPAAFTGPAAWHVELTLPPNVVAVLNGQVSPASPTETTFVVDTVAERLALAVLPAKRAPVSTIEVAGGTITFVGRAAQRPNVQKQVRALVEQDWPFATPPRLVVVTDHDRERLATAGPGVVYLSDRAFRLSPGLARFHWPAARRALYAAASGLPDWDAQFVATALAEGRPAPSVGRSLGWAAWNPIIDELLTDGTLPFYGDTFSEAHLAPADALLTLAGRRNPRAAALQARDLLGADGVAALVTSTLHGGPAPVVDAARTAGVPAAIVEGWLRAEDPAQDLHVLSRAGRPVAVEREGGRDAEPVVVKTDAAAQVWTAAPGATLELPNGTKTVAVDPDARLLDADRTDNRAPPRWSTVVTGWVDDISPSQGSFTAWGDVVLRRQGDTHWLYVLGATHDAQDLLSLNATVVRYLGPEVTRRLRAHRLYFSFGPSLLDPSYAGAAEGQVVLGGSVNYLWDTRTADTYAFSGHRFSVGASTGALLGSDQAWASAGTSYVQLLPITPRHVIATRLRAGWTSGDLANRLLPLGGADAVRAASEREVVGNERAVANVEYRWTVVHDASLPLPLLWLSEVQVVPGVEAGVVYRHGDADPVAAYGADLGLYTVVDVFGARPTLFGVVGALPLGVADPVPQLYFSFDHAF